MITVTTYAQDRDEQFLKEHPKERYRCDIFVYEDRSDHHGVGATEDEALFNAAVHFRQYAEKKRRVLT